MSATRHSNTGVSGLMHELFEIYASILRTCGGPSSGNGRSARRNDFAARLHGAPRLVRAVTSHVERLQTFHDRHGETIRGAMRALGGVKLAREANCDFDASEAAAMCLFVDTQLMPDPVLTQRKCRQNLFTPPELEDYVAAAQSVVPLSPLVKADLPIPPFIIYWDNNAEAELARYDPDLILGDQMSPWRRIHEARKPLYVDEVRSYFGIRDEGRLKHEAEMRSYLDIYRVRAHLTVCELLFAEPIMCDEPPADIYRAFSSILTSELAKVGFLSKEAILALHALQEREFRWLQNVPIASLPGIIAYQENQRFRERLEEQVKYVQNASLNDLSEATIQVAHALLKMIAEHEKTMLELADKHRPKYVRIAGGGTLGMLIAGGVSVWAPALGSTGQAGLELLISGATAIGVAGTSVVSATSEMIEHVVDKRTARRSLFGIIAKAARSK